MNERKRVNIKTILVDPVLRKEIVEGATDFICKVEGLRPHSLSPAAQAVLWAGLGCDSDRLVIAAALQAAADQLIPPVEFDRRYTTQERWDARDDIRFELLAIAAELEAQP